MRRRPLRILGAALLYAGFSVVSPLAMVAGPLAVMLLLYQPGRREMLLAAMMLGLVVVDVVTAASSFGRIEATWVLLVTGAAAAVVGRRGIESDLVNTGLLVVGAAAVAAVLLIGVTTHTWSEVRWAAENHFGWKSSRVMGLLLASARTAPEAQVVETLRASATATVKMIGTLFPGLVMLQALAAMAAGLAVYRMVVREPRGPALPKLKDFRFNDHLIWGVVLALVAVVTPGLGSVRVLGGNIGVFFGGLYAARGLGVISGLAAAVGMNGPFSVLLGVLITVFLMPLALFTALGLGVSDTWVDWRKLVLKAKQRQD